MDKPKTQDNVFQVVCPHCQTVLWVDGASQEVIRTEKPAKKKGSLDDLLEKEKKRMSEFERKFEATAELEKKKLAKAKEKFEKAILNIDKEDKADE